MTKRESNPHEEPLRRAARAADAGDLEQLRSILDADPFVLEARDESGQTLLALACRSATGDIAIPPNPGTPGQHAAVDLILAAGADPSATTPDGWAPLHTAAMSGHRDLAVRLLDAGATRTGRLYGSEGGSPLALALFYAKTEVAEVLASPPEPDNLRCAAALGRGTDRFVESGQLTSQAGEGLDFYRPILLFPEWRRTSQPQEILDEALSWASRNDQCDSMAELVALGANVNSNAYRGTPLLWAVYSDRVAAATWLLDHGADPDLRHDFGGSGHGVEAVALHLAAQFGATGCLRLLLDRGADRTIVDGAHGGTPTDWARHSGAHEAVKMLEE